MNRAFTPQRTLWLVVGLCFAVMPVAAAEYMPLSDIPQHLAQVRLLEEMLHLRPTTVAQDALVVRWLGANTLVYLPLFLLCRVVPMVLAGKLLVAMLLCACVWAFHDLAARRGRDPRHALAAGCLLFNVSLYWGFLNFVCGLPLFLWFTGRVLAADRPSPGARVRAFALSALVVMLLFWAHVMWLPFAALVALVASARRRAWKALVWHALSFVPAGVTALLWLPGFMQFRVQGSASESVRYLASIGARFQQEWLVACTFGGIQGPIEIVASYALLAYAAVVLGSAIKRRDRDYDVELGLIGALILLFVFLAPDIYLNTILLGPRFMVCAAGLLLLCLPALRSSYVAAALGVAAAAFSTVTAIAWALFDQDELSGLRESLAAVERPVSMLGLDYRRTSPQFRAPAFLHMPAYFQATHGGELGFSFAEHGSSIVSYREPRTIGWHPALEWFPARATQQDVDQFDCILVVGEDADHARFTHRYGRQSKIKQGYIRVYCKP